ncbi:MAG TPA: hypothetical protein VK169_16555 [Saprospiraceae bacterium]|jgi:hypothetical protein|nr:hypothetical protein [Saprospiraceae bacterium]
MSKFIKYSCFVALFIFLATSQQSCKTNKEGCGQEEAYAPDMESKGGKSNLFSKGQRKKMKKKG